MATAKNKSRKKAEAVEPAIEPEIEAGISVEPEALGDGEQDAVIERGNNSFLRKLMDVNFIEYASYVIKERAIPDVDDGLKPVQRRILWSLHRMDDGKFHKVANVIGHSMQFHPHGDASIGDALVVLSNKEYFIEKQGNFGNIFTGDPASAARYIECRLSPLGREVLFNNDITEFTPSYDGRNQEPVVLPVKIPSLLMLGTEGIAVGMATRILPHNFNELLNAQIACLRGEDFELYPDFQQGGLMDVAEYNEGNGKITLRAKIEKDGRRLIVREIPAVTNTEKLIASVENAVEKGKLKIASINDFTTDRIEIEIIPMRGYDPDKAMQALYTYTDCAVSVSVNLMVICENRPVLMTVPDIIRRNTAKLLEYLKRELELEMAKQEGLFHSKTLSQIFFENRIYKRMEKCESEPAMFEEVHKGLQPHLHLLRREVTEDDLRKLVEHPVRRISSFDIRKNQEELQQILENIDQIKKNLADLGSYATAYLKALLHKYGHLYPRRTEIETFAKIDRRAAALNNIKVGWDRGGSYIGTAVKSDDMVTCNEFDHLLCVERTGQYKVINIPEKVFIGKLYDFRKYDKDTEFGVIYSDKKTGKSYIKRCMIAKFITDREYQLCPDNCRLELFTPRTDAIYELQVETKVKNKSLRQINLMEAPIRGARSRGLLLESKKLQKITHVRWLTPEEIEAARLIAAGAEPDPDAETENGDNGTTVEAASEVVTAPVAEQEVQEPAVPSRRRRKTPEPEVDKLPIEIPPEPEVREEPEPPAAVPKHRKKTPKPVVEEEPEADEAEVEITPEPPEPPEPPKKAKAPVVPPVISAQDSDDDWGIEQPELGF